MHQFIIHFKDEAIIINTDDKNNLKHQSVLQFKTLMSMQDDSHYRLKYLHDGTGVYYSVTNAEDIPNGGQAKLLLNVPEPQM